MDNDFQRPTCKKSKLWSAIARKLAETGGYGVSGPECDIKWCNLQATYKRNKDKKGTSGHKAVTCRRLARWSFISSVVQCVCKFCFTLVAAV